VSHLRRHLHRFSGFALLVTLVFALLPTASQALAGAVAGQPWTEVCSAARKERAAAPTPTPDGSAAAVQTDHCALCGQGMGPLALAVDPAPAGVLQVGVKVVPARVGRAPKPQFTWGSAQPQAPPRTA
jgi:hypothetical protein